MTFCDLSVYFGYDVGNGYVYLHTRKI